MPRAVLRPEVTVTEEISNITHFPVEQLLHFLVGKGTEQDGVFNFTVPQQFEAYDIKGPDYVYFIAKYPAGFSKDDLWDYVDIIRDGANSPRPSSNYDWDPGSKSWIANIARAKELLKQRVDEERVRLSNLPITHADITIDANEVAKTNIDGKLAEIAAVEVLGLSQDTINKIWRDSSNVTHAWGTLEEYKAWLNGLIVALSQRSTNLYLAAWAHKANIDALDNVPAIEAYDIAANWQVNA